MLRVEPVGRVERGVRGGVQVPADPHVGRPGDVLWIQRADDQEAVRRTGAGGLDQQPIEARLSVGRIRAEVAECTSKVLGRVRDRRMQARVDRAVQRRRAPSTPAGAQLVEQRPAAETQVQVELGNQVRREIARALGDGDAVLVERREGHRGIEIVEDLQRARRIEHQAAGGEPVGAIRRHHRHVRATAAPTAAGIDRVPVVVQHELAEVRGGAGRGERRSSRCCARRRWPSGPRHAKP